MIHGYEIVEIESPTSLELYFDNKPPRLWCLGNATILTGKLLGLISARQIEPDLALKSSQVLKQLSSLEEVSFIGGWHSPLEEEALRILSIDSARIVFCVSKALHRFVPPLRVKNGMNDGRVLLLTHCGPKTKRISRDASLRRNQVVTGLAMALLVLSAPERSASLKLAKSALGQGKPVFTLDHRMNKELLAAGAKSATLENLHTATG